ncbi:hypothetical protein MWN34_16505 [Ancylobacter sp. 6x-1]|uniref:Uncharacterized protein n=1 Tax=Ancylobacter crimeensis TaxID=2579147 RepID=A0ABT0DF66_9HYPH|nr:hypothetical protein [Ancylobacter crimeensis]MCK0198514.1 hypothetical protein [Ancylobacter crimeensis]
MSKSELLRKITDMYRDGYDDPADRLEPPDLVGDVSRGRHGRASRRKLDEMLAFMLHHGVITQADVAGVRGERPHPPGAPDLC